MAFRFRSIGWNHVHSPLLSNKNGTVLHELIYHDAGAQTPEGLTVEQLHRLIHEAGREPVEQDTLYRRVHRDGTTGSIGEPILVS